MPRKLLYYRLRTLAFLSIMWLLFGIVFFFNLIKPENDLGVRVSIFQFSIAFGIIGLIISTVLIFFLKPAFHHYPIWVSTVLKLGIVAVLFFVIAFVLLMLYFFITYNNTLHNYFESFFSKLVHTYTFLNFNMDLALMTLLSIVSIEVTDKYGPGMFWSMLRGEYLKPKIENRIFIFIDINESTAIAEQLGHDTYFRMLRDFFNDVTLAVLGNDGSIYQYVGDEIVVSWPTTPENKIKSLKFIRNAYFLLERYAKRYQARYGVAPTFKAGIHAGEVTAGFIGIVKRDLIYCGDTLNTAARITSMCHELNESFVISEDFMIDFNQPFGYEIKEIGKLELKGRAKEVDLFSLKFDS